ncbi:MAG: transglutaminase domain-containing protein [Butyrivibrio sp.]
MRKLHFDYYMKFVYSEKVEKCHYTIKCIPKNTAAQRTENINIQIEPENDYCLGEDSFGNQTVYGSIYKGHENFVFHITGNVTTGLLDYEPENNPSTVGVFRYPSGKTKDGAGLQAYFAKIRSDNPELFGIGGSDYNKAVHIMHCLYKDFGYQKNITGIDTTAEEAWNLGKGVCQDYAHILITLCRLAGIPARYVVGMMTGEGYSHAWVEILSENRWYGLDPTNDVVVTESHIKIGTGRDVTDCMINRGILTGGGNQSQFIRVLVEETEID